MESHAHITVTACKAHKHEPERTAPTSAESTLSLESCALFTVYTEYRMNMFSFGWLTCPVYSGRRERAPEKLEKKTNLEQDVFLLMNYT